MLDPASGIDAIRNVALIGRTIAAFSTAPLRGKVEIDATGLVVAPGFIDLHSHGQTPENYRYKAMDGVTTALELEVGGVGREADDRLDEVGLVRSDIFERYSESPEPEDSALPGRGLKNESGRICGEIGKPLGDLNEE